MKGLKTEMRYGIKEILPPILITLVVVHLLVLVSIRPYGYNYSSMIRIVEHEWNEEIPEYFQKGFVIFTDKGGYDGKYYYYASMDLFKEKHLFKNPFRMQRILYPLLSRLLTFGDLSLLPYTMYAVNMISIALGLYFFILILEMYSLSPFWSLFYGLAPPSIMTIQYDLPSPLSIFLIIAAVYYYLKEKPFTTAVFFALAFLTREDSIVVLLPLMLWDYQVNRRFTRLLLLAGSLIPFFIWQSYITFALGDAPVSTSATVLNPIPFSGIVGYFKAVEYAGMTHAFRVLSVVIVLIFFMVSSIVVARVLRGKRDPFYYVVAAYCLLVAFTVESQWDNYNGLLRMFYGFFPFLTLSYCVNRNVWIKYCVYFIGVLSVLTAVRIMFVSTVFPYKVW